MVFYKYNPFTGRVASSPQLATYNPQGLSPLVEAEPGFRFDTKLTTAVSVAPAMASGGGMPSVEARGIVPSAPGYQSVMKLQKAWAVDDGLLVWQKRGMRDKLPMWATFALMGVGLVYSFSILYKMSFPAPPPSED